MSNLIELQKKYILDLLDAVETTHNIKFLVIDAFTDALFEYIFESRNELLSHVTSVDKIDARSRKGQPSVDVIYLLQPTKFNINCIEADFSNRPSKYKRAHIRFLPGMEQHILQFFHSKHYIKQYLASISEAKIAFLPRESKFFQTLDIDKPLQIFFNKNCNDLIEKNIKRTIQSLLNICIVTGEYPIIRYSEASEEEKLLTPSSRLAEKLAKEFQMVLDSYVRDNEDFPPPSKRPRSIMIITDRLLDPLSPILHDFSYQAMAYDISNRINPRSDIYTYNAENELGEIEEKTSRLCGIQDPDWIDLRHQHIVDANEFLQGRIKELIAKNPLLVDRSNVKTANDLVKVVVHLKDFDEERRRIILHKTLIDECLEANHSRKLATLAEVEQNLAGFGLDIDGEKVKHITESLLHILTLKECEITDKIRAILIYALYRGGLIESDFIKLLAFIGINQDDDYFTHFMTLFKNYHHLGFKLVKEKSKSKPFKKGWYHDSIVKDSSIYTTSRFIPSVANIVSKLIANPLLISEDDFPYVKDKPIELLDEEEREAAGVSANAFSSASLRSSRHKASWRKNTSNLQDNIERQRLFYYVLGGITYSEIRVAYEQSNLKNKDVFIGSDGITTPLSYITSIEFIDKPRELLNLKDDQRQKERAPEFLTESLAPVATPVSHVHVRSHNEPLKPKIIEPVVQQPEKEKKFKKFKKFLRTSKDK
ncbi:hypothetical protein KAFR_0B05880 [Kazachstania africana CBS 2517]|uniref:Uncharacterized protein n=1 Tax=Kazachstania africana (strain ATCC 22294 / BCRC 22015 / CBS 2517 / CECT 1963 / NBRC 1671 / NRRL Y-8276) TaxID=1071382 RepID=H2AR84_KAZAF|nr:hypothetical protein KAFR_0B05880 [Kazachstania africana CBS 2517]CCF56884.1 hypothetical protein KAFR_0B05880 [Kazachstania africana CBS 2517]